MKIAIFFPGMGYHTDKPLLYYSRKLATKHGYDKIINISYSYNGPFDKEKPETLNYAFNEIFNQTKSKLSDINWDEYEDILFVSKSIGTIVASAYAHDMNIDCKHILYTPLKQTFQFQPKNAIAFSGTNDPWIELNEISDLCAQNSIPFYTYADANHSLETGDVLLDISRMSDIILITENYIKV